MLEEFYTPDYLADQLVGHIDNIDPQLIVDTAAGNGALLLAAKRRWNEVTAVGFDISIPALGRLRRNSEIAHAGKRNVLCNRSQQTSQLGNRMLGRADLVLINPPFGCRGGRLVDREQEGGLRMSKPMYFLFDALSFLPKGGIVAAVLPEGCFWREADLAAWNQLNSVLAETRSIKIPAIKIKEWNSSVRLFYAIKSGEADIQSSEILMANNRSTFKHLLTLGKISNSKRKKFHRPNGHYFIHTTELRDEGVVFARKVAGGSSQVVSGPALLFPRVGQPDQRKIAILKKDEEGILSDCVFALQLKSLKECREIRGKILSDWEDFRNLYRGTGAPFITKSRLQSYLNSIL